MSSSRGLRRALGMSMPAPETPPDAEIRLIVGLGNPGPKYARTRHNVGWMVLDALAARLDAGRPATKFAGVWRDARGPHGPIALLAPQTFMNESGRSVGPAAGSLHLVPSQILVLHDEIDIPFGDVRGKHGGGSGGHNGLRSIEQGIGARDFSRIRIGVGRQSADFRGDEAAWVLANFSEPAADVESLIAAAVAMAETVLTDGITAAIARHHARPPGASARARAARREGDSTGDGDVSSSIDGNVSE